jgi:hypothetical protein
VVLIESGAKSINCRLLPLWVSLKWQSGPFITLIPVKIEATVAESQYSDHINEAGAIYPIHSFHSELVQLRHS